MDELSQKPDPEEADNVPTPKIVVVNQDKSYEDFVYKSVLATCKLFYLLESVQTAPDLNPESLDFAPCPLSVALEIRPVNKAPDPASIWGTEGMLAQLAYVGWMAEIDGAWTKYRESKPHGDSGNLKHGIETELMGDFHKVRNDIVKNGAIAQSKTGNCKVLDWFNKGEQIILKVRHVVDFLHKLGVWYGNDMLHARTSSWLKWRFRADGWRSSTIVSHRAEIQQQEGKWVLALSVAFADGVCGCYAIEVAETADELKQRRDRLATARQCDYRLVLDDGEEVPLHGFHEKARKDVLSGKRVNHLWSFPMKIRDRGEATT
ncbi:MAG: hypothetical protein F4160_05475 [Rhodospirillaceae bacterium]|nr:hypothetical protein [Rhodospirillaceae bacterium]MYH36231.1 hypothetical protein [Rhodospirillaceae bacterium]